MVPTPTTLFSVSQPAPWPHGEFPMISWQKERRLGPGLQVVLHDMQVPPESGRLQHYSPCLGHPWRTWWREILPVGRTLSSVPGGWLCLEGEVASELLIHGLWPMVWLDGQGLGRNMIGKLVTRKFGKEECGWTLSPARLSCTPLKLHGSFRFPRHFAVCTCPSPLLDH